MNFKKVSAFLLSGLALGAIVAYTTTKSTNSGYEGDDLPFTWQNTNLYFVITDRFSNGDKSNDNSYGRPIRIQLATTLVLSMVEILKALHRNQTTFAHWV